MKREDTYKVDNYLRELSDEQLKERFWALLDEVTQPLVELGRENTSPSIERSVLLRMGFNSLEAKAIADGCVAHGLLGHGAGNVVYRVSKQTSATVEETGKRLAAGELWDTAVELFKAEV